MRKIMIRLFLFSLIVVSNNPEAQWVQVPNGMGNISVRSFACIGNNIFAGTSPSNGVYISTNNGNNWTQTTLNNRQVYALATSGNNIFAGVSGSGVYLSTNNGNNWTQTTLDNRTIYSLATSGTNIFAGTSGDGVYISTNNGANWTQTPFNYAAVWSLVITGNNIFAAISNSGVHLSTNNGNTWTLIFPYNQQVYSLATSGNNIFAGTSYDGVYISTNNGTSWTQTSLDSQYVNALAVNGNNVFAGDFSGVFVSNDNGTNWTQRNEGLGNGNSVRAFCILNNYIFAGTNVIGVWRRPLSELIGIKPISNEIPTLYSLSQNYPNPFNPNTIINFQIPKNNFVTLKIYDILGREVAALVNEQLKPGTYQVDWDGSHYSSGVYFYKLIAGDYVETRKMILMK